MLQFTHGSQLKFNEVLVWLLFQQAYKNLQIFQLLNNFPEFTVAWSFPINSVKYMYVTRTALFADFHAQHFSTLITA